MWTRNACLLLLVRLVWVCTSRDATNAKNAISDTNKTLIFFLVDIGVTPWLASSISLPLWYDMRVHSRTVFRIVCVFLSQLCVLGLAAPFSGHHQPERTVRAFFALGRRHCALRFHHDGDYICDSPISPLKKLYCRHIVARRRQTHSK